jgi:hypothetical protein
LRYLPAKGLVEFLKGFARQERLFRHFEKLLFQCGGRSGKLNPGRESDTRLFDVWIALERGSMAISCYRVHTYIPGYFLSYAFLLIKDKEHA